MITSSFSSVFFKSRALSLAISDAWSLISTIIDFLISVFFKISSASDPSAPPILTKMYSDKFSSEASRFVDKALNIYLDFLTPSPPKVLWYSSSKEVSSEHDL